MTIPIPDRPRRPTRAGKLGMAVVAAELAARLRARLRAQIGGQRSTSRALVPGQVFLSVHPDLRNEGLSILSATSRRSVFDRRSARRSEEQKTPGLFLIHVLPGREDDYIKQVESMIVVRLTGINAAQFAQEGGDDAAFGGDLGALHAQAFASDRRLRALAESELPMIVPGRLPWYRASSAPLSAHVASPVGNTPPGGVNHATIALLDTGVNISILQAARTPTDGISRVPGIYARSDGQFTPEDRYEDYIGRHGTAMAACIREHAPNNPIVVYPIAKDGWPANAIVVNNMLEECDNDETRIINLSWAADEDPAERDHRATYMLTNRRLIALTRRGIAVVCAVGNNNHPGDGIGYPANHPDTIAVGAIFDDSGILKRCTDSRFEAGRLDDGTSYMWVEDGGDLADGHVRRAGIDLPGLTDAGSSVAAARATGRIAAWMNQRDTSHTPTRVDDLKDNLRRTPNLGQSFDEFGHGWARPAN